MTKKYALLLEPDEFTVIYQFLYMTKLGSNNRFEKAVSNFMRDIEPDLEKFLPADGVVPEIKVEFSDSDGLVFSVS